MERSNTVFFWRKPVLNYILACMTLRARKARGRNLSRVVNMVEVLKNRFMANSQIADIQISAERLEGGGGVPSNISNVDITVKA